LCYAGPQRRNRGLKRRVPRLTGADFAAQRRLELSDLLLRLLNLRDQRCHIRPQSGQAAPFVEIRRGRQPIWTVSTISLRLCLDSTNQHKAENEHAQHASALQTHTTLLEMEGA
jgi:hypothetical protein